ncbi:MAG: MauE/DoxX family redox-associated membrane protein [Algibacter sp.]
MKIYSKHKNVFLEFICFLFMLLFMYTAICKFLVFGDFKIQIEQAPLLSDYASWLAWIIPSVEILVALLLMVPQLRILALYTALALTEMFSLYLFIILNFDDHIPFSCGGILGTLDWTELLSLNIVFMALASIGVMIWSVPKYVNL